MEEQEVGGQQILDAVGRLKEITTSVQEGSKNISKSGSCSGLYFTGSDNARCKWDVFIIQDDFQQANFARHLLNLARIL